MNPNDKQKDEFVRKLSSVTVTSDELRRSTFGIYLEHVATLKYRVLRDIYVSDEDRYYEKGDVIYFPLSGPATRKVR